MALQQTNAKASNNDDLSSCDDQPRAKWYPTTRRPASTNRTLKEFKH